MLVGLANFSEIKETVPGYQSSTITFVQMCKIELVVSFMEYSRLDKTYIYYTCQCLYRRKQNYMTNLNHPIAILEWSERTQHLALDRRTTMPGLSPTNGHNPFDQSTCEWFDYLPCPTYQDSQLQYSFNIKCRSEKIRQHELKLTQGQQSSSSTTPKISQ